MGRLSLLVEGLSVTVIGVLIVAVILLVISFMIDVFRVMSQKKEQKPEQKLEVPVAPAIVETDDSELVAVITAAIAASLGTQTDRLVVRSIKKAVLRGV
ncbi:hypothetical protein FACS1894188_13430 [Clostridia bacterium]|nr:hypothetical protein FACS1894188_13430 [Clostridia bacterium]